MIKSIQEGKSKEFFCVIFTGDQDPDEKILENVKNRFNITIDPDRIKFHRLTTRWCVEAKTWPVATIFGQSIGAIVLAIEAVSKCNPHILIDSMGYSFVYPIFKLLGNINVCCYVHYPTISTDMLSVVQQRKSTHNNNSTFSSSPILSKIKLIYYHFFTLCYKFVAASSDLVMVNSSWTEEHIRQIWTFNDPPYIIYPPSGTEIESPPCLSEDDEKWETTLKPLSKREHIILSIGQFRPEKDHQLQIKIFSHLLKNYSGHENKRLVLLGSCRHEEDQKRIDELKKLVESLGLTGYVTFEINLPYEKVKDYLDRATIGIHTMWNEHFGIGVVEFMRNGLIAVAHNSGGPKMDIVAPFEGEPTGYLASTDKEYSSFIDKIFKNIGDHKMMQRRAFLASNRFSDSLFRKEFLFKMNPLLKKISS